MQTLGLDAYILANINILSKEDSEKKDKKKEEHIRHIETKKKKKNIKY